MNVVDRQKEAAAEAAVALVKQDDVVGLGTGSTAEFAIDALIRRARAGLRITCIPTSERSARRARAGGLTLLAEPTRDRQIDITIDGADEVLPGRLDLIKGLGGALLHEKIVAAATKRLVIIADEGKLVERLGERAPVPVEVVTFGWESTRGRLARLGAESTLRLGLDGKPFVTDSGNYILDCRFPVTADLSALEGPISGIVGVIESGLFVGMAQDVMLGVGDGGAVKHLIRD